MSDKPTIAAIEGWYTMDADKPHLIGTSCNSCGTYYFPKLSTFCKNPSCEGEEFTEVQLSRTGKIWSYTDSQYKPPEPFIAADPYVPYTVAAVQLEKEKMIVLGQVVAGVGVDQLKVGDDVELVLETLYENDEANKIIWKWKPVA
ncbi:MAG: OB-fold domain-containing protein [Pseudomonadales bacterium]|nr:OB-fold domain-containing protein [Pseudomonadales bacterium]